MGPTSTVCNMKTDTRGTQTDLVTDRNINDCLMEVKSSAEFQDLSYRLSKSCKGEMNLIVTRESTLGLLGAPFDPLSVTVTASGYCYFSALFVPVEVINLKDKPNGDLNLRKFRNILWKLNGRSGYGFCPGFKEDDFPAGFAFEAYGLKVLRYPFTRVQSNHCPVFLQHRRSNLRVLSQPLQLKLCPDCYDAVNAIFVSFKNAGKNLSLKAFAKFLPYDSSFASAQPPGPKLNAAEIKNSKSRASINKIPLIGENNSDSSSSSVITISEIETDDYEESVISNDTTSHSKVHVHDPSVLLDCVGPRTDNDVKTDIVSASTSSEMATVISYPGETLSCPSASPWSAVSSVASSSTSSGRSLMQVQADSSTSRPVLSALVKPFRTVLPSDEGPNDVIPQADDAESGVPEIQTKTQAKNETSEADPPFLTPQMVISSSPDLSPQPLLIDEEAEIEEVEIGTSETDAKKLCCRCSLCEEAFSSVEEMQQHSCQQHQDVVDLTSDMPGNMVTVDCEETASISFCSDESDQSLRGKVCPICHQFFSAKEELEEHLISRHGTRLHPCRYCGQKFALKKNLADHLQRHRGTKTLTCKECGSKFTKKKEFATHVRKHMGSVPFFCSICSKLFSRKSSYEDHMERHRARRGIRAVLAGNEKTKQEIMSKARKCLEEKAMLTSSSAITSETSASLVPSGIRQAAPLSDSVSSASSNLVLLSTVSLARAEYDRQPVKESDGLTTSRGISPQGVMDRSDAAAQLVKMSTVQDNVTPSSSIATKNSVQQVHPQQNLVSSQPRPEESHVLLQRVEAPMALPDTGVDGSKGVQHSQTKRIQDMVNIHMPVTSISVGTAKTTQPYATISVEAEAEDSSTSQPLGKSDQVQLSEREQRLKQKEEELREREKNITKKSLLFFRQLLMAQYAQQSGTDNSATITPSKGGKPIYPQAAAVLAALNSMRQGMGRGAPSVIQPGPVKSSPADLATGAAVTQRRDMQHENVTLTSKEAEAAQSVPANQLGSSNISTHGPLFSAGPHVNAQHFNAALHPVHSVKNKMPVVPASDANHPSAAASMNKYGSTKVSQGTIQTPNPCSSSVMRQPGQTSPQKGNFFLQELMKLESKMPKSARQFLPVSHKKKLQEPPQSPVMSRPIFMAGLAGETGVKGKGRPGRNKGSNESAGDGSELQDVERTEGKPKGKRGAWSGGLVKEKLNPVVTMVPPLEMERLLSLTKPPSPVAELVVSSSPLPCSTHLSSPVATPSLSTEISSPLQDGIVSPSQLSSGSSSPNEINNCTSTYTASSAVSPVHTNSPQPLPLMKTPSVIVKSCSRRPTHRDDTSAISGKCTPEEVGPIDLTKGNSSKTVTSEKKTRTNLSGEEVSARSQSRILRHVLLDSTSSQELDNEGRKPELKREKTLTSRSEIPDLVQHTDLSVPGGSPQSAVNAARIQASIQAMQNPNLSKSESMALLQHFLPTLAASQQASSQRPNFPQFPQLRMTLPSQCVLPGQGLSLPTMRPVKNAHLSQTSQLSRSHSADTEVNHKPSSASAIELGQVGGDISAQNSHSYQTSSTLTSLSSMQASPGATSSRTVVPNFLLLAGSEPKSDADQQSQSVNSKPVNKYLSSNNPLGGFKWHRPAASDPHQTNEDSAASEVDANQATCAEVEKNKDNMQSDLTADQSLWQQQFLQTLRENRRQHLEQQMKQMQDIHREFAEGGDGASNSEKQTCQRRKRQKKNTSVAALLNAKRRSTDGAAHPEAMDMEVQVSHGYHNHALAQAGTSGTQAISVVSQDVKTGTAQNVNTPKNRGSARSRSGKNGRIPSKNKKTAAGPLASEVDVAESSKRRQEERQELQEFGKSVEVKVEPLEEGVHCDGCGEVFYNEVDILQHDCDAHQ